MLGFVTTIRHPLNATSYERVETLLEASLGSVSRQDSDEYIVVIVHNRKPNVSVRGPHIRFVEVDFPPPSATRSARIGLGPGHLDKGYKAVVGAQAAIGEGATHVMFFDADDYVHRGLAGFVGQRVAAPGWFSDFGFIHSRNSRQIAPVPCDFDKKAGSTSILRSDLLRIPSELPLRATQAEIDDALGKSTAGYLFGSHDKWRDHARSCGFALEPLPFAASVWEIGTGENLSGIVKSSRSTVRVSAEIEHDYGLVCPSLRSHFLAAVGRTVERARRRAGG